MFYLELDQFADACAGCRHVSDSEIPPLVFFFFQPAFQNLVVFLADHVFDERHLLDLDGLEAQFFLSNRSQVPVDGMDPLIDGTRFLGIDKSCFVG